MGKYRGFFDTGHMNMYLSGSVIMCRNKPIYVAEVSEDEQIIYHWVGERGNDKLKAIHIYDKRVDFNPVKLGFTNITYEKYEVTTALSRIPARMYKTGLHRNNTHGERIGHDLNITWPNETFTLSLSLKNTILGIYPSINSIMTRLRKGARSIAFSRHFCFGAEKENKDILLYYYKYKKPVGIWNGTEPRLLKEYSFLQEHLERMIP